MNLILHVIIVTYFCVLRVNCRSVQVDINSELQAGNHDHGNVGILSWKRLKPLLRREVQRIRNVKDMEENNFNKRSTELPSSIHSKTTENMFSENLGIDKNEEFSLKAESQMINALESELASIDAELAVIESELVKKNHNQELISKLDKQGDFTTNIAHAEMIKSDPPLTTYDFPEHAISDVFNKSGDSIVFQALNDNSSKSFEFDETTLLSEGGEIASMQEVSTIGNEHLIDSETTQNLILSEMLSSQSSFIGDHLADFTHEDDSNVATSAFNHNNESELKENTIDEETQSKSDIGEFSIDEVENENTESDLVDSLKDSLSGISINTEMSSTSKIAGISTDEIERDNIELAKISTDEIERDNTELAEISTDKIENDDVEVDQKDAFRANVNKVLTYEETSSNSDLAGYNAGENENTELDLIDLFLDSETEASLKEGLSNNSHNIESHAGKLGNKTSELDLEHSFEDNVPELSVNEEMSGDSEITEFHTHEVDYEKTELDLTDSFQIDDTSAITEPSNPKCPDPGWCVFWFLALEDTCAKDSHCHGSLICCMWGCTKACIDPNDI